MKRMLKSTLAICLVLMMALSTIAVSATTTEAEAAELTTVYTKDFTKDTDLTGWTNQSAWSYNAATASDLKTNIAPQTVTFYENNLGDNFEINATMGYSYNGVEFLLNGNGSTNAEGIKVYQGKGTYTEEFDEADEAHQTYKEKNPNAQKYSYTIEFLEVYINGKKPADWKTLIYVEDADKDRAQVQTMTDAGAIKNVRATNLEYKTENVNISYNNGTLSFKAEGIGYGEIREFTYDVTQGGTVVPPTNKGYFGLKTESGAWLYNIEIKKEISQYITVYEQDFTKADATTESWSLVNMNLLEGTGVQADSSTTASMVYNKELGNNWRISGSVNRGYNGESYLINSDAKIQSNALTYSGGYKIQQNKNIGTQVSMITSSSSATTVKDWNNVPTATYRTFDFEIINKNGKVQYIYSLDGSIYTNYEFDLTSYKSGKFAIIEDADTFTLKNIKIEVVPDDYLTVYEQDFTAADATTEGWTVNDAVSIDSSKGLVINKDGFGTAIFNKELSNDWKISGVVKYDYVGFRFFVNSDITLAETNGMDMQNGYRINQSNGGYSLEELCEGGISNSYVNIKNIAVQNDSYGIDRKFEITYKNKLLTYKVINPNTGLTIAEFEQDVTDGYNEGATREGIDSGLFAISNVGVLNLSLKNIKIEMAYDYAVADAEAIAKSNGNVKYSAIVHNNSGNPVTGAVLVAAAYDADKNLIGATVIDDYTGAVGKQLVDGEIEIENGKKADEVVIFFWDNFDSAYPLYEQTTIEL